MSASVLTGCATRQFILSGLLIDGCILTICMNALIWVVNETSNQRDAELIIFASMGTDGFENFAQQNQDSKLLALCASVSSTSQV